MRKTIAILALVLAAAISIPVIVLGQEVVTERTEYLGQIRVHNITWSADASGEASSEAVGRIEGEVLRLVFSPSASPDAPSANYDITLTDRDGYDVFGGSGANLSSTEVKSSTASPSYVAGSYTFAVANAGASGEGVVRIFTRP